jgi:broad specificity phosphatase PhoE
LSTVYLVRHGQAGTRDAYDSLSDLGKNQARLLGEHFASRGIHFASAYTGALLRQRQTAQGVSAAYAAAGISFPDLVVEPRWNEFDLGRVFSETAPLLCAEDPEFRTEYEKMREQVRVSNGAHAASVHRKWLPCDTKIVNAWTSGRYPYSGETWEQFRERIVSCRLSIEDAQRGNIIVFTSATPVAIWAGLSLDIFDDRLFRLAGAMYNTSYTVFRLREGQLRLFTFNAAPHLGTSEIRTHR